MSTLPLLVVACAGSAFALGAAPFPGVVAAVLLATNGAALAAFVWDKHQAIVGGGRTPERVLHALCVLGGCGALLARGLARHKTRKAAFDLSCLAGALVPWGLGWVWQSV